MKRPLFGFALVLIVALAAGCANSARQPYLASTMQRSKSFALAVTVNGGLQPTPMQWAAIQAKFADEFSWRGWVLVTDLALADYIVRVDFTPDAIDPENTGTVAVLGIRNNPRNVLASTTSVSRYPTSFGYAGSFQNALWAPGFSSMYYGWGDSYYDGYSYSSPTLNPVRPPTVVSTHPPYRHHKPDDPTWCPPGRTNLPPHDHDHKRPPSFLPGDFAAPLPPTTAPAPMIASSERSHRWSENHRSSDGNAYTRTDSGSTGSSGITYSRGGSNTSSSDRTYARSDASGSRDWSSWRDRNSRSDSTVSDSTSSRSDSSSSSWRDRSSQSGSTYTRSDSGYSRSGSDSSSSRGSWGGSSASRSDSGTSYSRSGSDSSHSHSGSDSGYSRGGSSSSSSGSSGGSYSSSSHSSGSSSSASSSSSGGSSSSSSNSSSTTGSVSSHTTQQN